LIRVILDIFGEKLLTHEPEFEGSAGVKVNGSCAAPSGRAPRAGLLSKAPPGRASLDWPQRLEVSRAARPIITATMPPPIPNLAAGCMPRIKLCTSSEPALGYSVSGMATCQCFREKLGYAEKRHISMRDSSAQVGPQCPNLARAEPPEHVTALRPSCFRTCSS
jgi:hypothetical protein